MNTQKEVRDDLEKFHDIIKEMEVKYGPEFSCAIAAGVGVHTEFTDEDDPDAYAGVCCVSGDPALLHQACHCLLKSARFIDEFMDTVKCVLMNEHKGRDEVAKKLLDLSIDSMKKMLIMATDEFKKAVAEAEAEEAVNKLLKGAGFK